MATLSQKTDEIAALESLKKDLAKFEMKQAKATKADVKVKIAAKIKGIREQIKAGKTKGKDVSAKQLANSLLRSRKKFLEMSKKDFNGVIRQLSKKPEYSFLKGMSRTEVINDINRKAKPVGWRFKGRENYKTPTKEQVRKGRANGTVYYENRPNRSDVSQARQLAKGGSLKGYADSEFAKLGRVWNETGIKPKGYDKAKADWESKGGSTYEKGGEIKVSVNNEERPIKEFNNLSEVRKWVDDNKRNYENIEIEFFQNLGFGRSEFNSVSIGKYDSIRDVDELFKELKGGGSKMAKGGEIKVGDKVKYPKAKMIGEVVSIEDDSAIPNEKSIKVKYKDGKEVKDLLSSFEVVSTSMGYDMENTYSTDDFKTYTTYAKGGEIKVSWDKKAGKPNVVINGEEHGSISSAIDYYTINSKKGNPNAEKNKVILIKLKKLKSGSTYAEGGEIKYVIVNDDTDKIYHRTSDKSFAEIKLKEFQEIYPNEKIIIQEFPKGGSTYAEGGEIERGEMVFVTSENDLIAEVIRMEDPNDVLVEFIGERPSGGDKIGSYKLSELKYAEYDWDNDKYVKMAKGGSTYAEGGQILSFSFNTDNVSQKEIVGIVENYTKDWRTSGDISNVNMFVTLPKLKANELAFDLKGEDVYDIEIQESRYAKGGSLKGHGLEIGDEIVNYLRWGLPKPPKDNIYVLKRGVVYAVDLSRGKRTMTKITKSGGRYKFEKGGNTEDETPVIRYYFEDDAYEYEKGGSTHNDDPNDLYGAFEKGGEVDINDIQIPVHYTMFEDEMYEYGKGGIISVGDEVTVRGTGKTMEVSNISKNRRGQVEFTGSQGTFLIGDLKKN